MLRIAFRSKFHDFDKIYINLLNEINGLKDQEKQIEEIKTTIENLTEERNAHSEIIAKINQVCSGNRFLGGKSGFRGKKVGFLTQKVDLLIRKLTFRSRKSISRPKESIYRPKKLILDSKSRFYPILGKRKTRKIRLRSPGRAGSHPGKTADHVASRSQPHGIPQPEHQRCRIT